MTPFLFNKHQTIAHKNNSDMQKTILKRCTDNDTGEMLYLVATENGLDWHGKEMLEAYYVEREG